MKEASEAIEGKRRDGGGVSEKRQPVFGKEIEGVEKSEGGSRVTSRYLLGNRIPLDRLCFPGPEPHTGRWCGMRG